MGVEKKEGMLSICRFVSVNAIYLLRHLNCIVGVVFVVFMTYVYFYECIHLVLAMMINIK